MKFVFEKLLTGRSNVVCVDGSFPAKLEVSHWHGNNSPVELKADTTTEMAFKLIESPNRNSLLDNIDVVSNNHFDADGLISAFVLVHPETALKIKNSLISIARTGDFAEYTTEDAFKANVVIETLIDNQVSPIKNQLAGKKYPEMMQIAYEKGFQILPELISSIEKYESHWKEEFEFFKRSNESFISQSSVFSNYSDCNLSVIESSFPLHRIAKYKYAEHDVVLSVVKCKDGNQYELEYKLYTWFDTVRPKKIERKSFITLLSKLKDLEKNEGEWQILGNNPVTEWDYRLIFTDKNFSNKESSIPVYEIENLLFEFLQ